MTFRFASRVKYSLALFLESIDRSTDIQCVRHTSGKGFVGRWGPGLRIPASSFFGGSMGAAGTARSQEYGEPIRSRVCFAFG